jgi:N-carbamoylputrescine amidase
MKVAVVSHRITEKVTENINSMTWYVQKAITEKATLVLFSETATTGLCNNNKPEHDLPLGDNIPGNVTQHFSNLAILGNIHVAFGLFEKIGNQLYDTAVLLNRQGKIALKYRRISKGWHWPNSDPAVYREGTKVTVANLDIGKVCFLLCGDLFDEDLVHQVVSLKPDLLLFPMARTINDSPDPQDFWDKEELPAYQEQVRKIGSVILMTGYLDKEYVGGATVFTANGEILVKLPIKEEGILFADITLP